MTHFKMRLTMAIAGLWAQVAAGQLTTVHTIDDAGSKGTLTYGINDAGDIVEH
jgi:hypothetical protein